MAIVSVNVCDECKEVGKRTGHWAVQGPDGSRVTMDLCDDHSEGLRQYMDRHRHEPINKPRREQTSPNRGRRKITTLEEIEASKKK